MLAPGTSRQELARRLNAAYAGGLLSDETFARRLDQVLGARLIDAPRLIGDLNLRRERRDWRTTVSHAIQTVLERLRLPGGQAEDDEPLVLGLEWGGETHELLVGRHHACDVVVSHPSVSRHHAELQFRDGSWILRDLDSTNGTLVNGVRVGRCQLHPGDLIELGLEQIRVD